MREAIGFASMPNVQVSTGNTPGMGQQYKGLTAEQVDFFMENGYVVIKQAFTRGKAAEWMENMWLRLGMDPNDKSTWTKERIHMPVHRREKVADFAPKAWAAITDLLGGEERIDEQASSWGDSFIVNLGTPETEGASPVHPSDLDNWHCDGDFFVHYLDSPEQALLVIPIFSDIQPRGGGTYIAPDGIDMIAQYLAAHPEGVILEDRTFRPSTSTSTTAKKWQDDPGFWSHLEQVKRCQHFVEVTGEVGDVVLLHPLMLHTASKNNLRVPRVITNPPVGLRAPFNFNRENVEDFSLVEKKTLKALGVDRLEFEPTTERRMIVPKRVLIQRAMLEAEQKRLEALKRSGEGLVPGLVPIAVA
ncbi:hypothetical protein BC835DRAFT_15079 [Cytidiella melzeri]|nr:hypothetical protein BC835DRAFT_15079 [Cytidiella melzeri]